MMKFKQRVILIFFLIFIVMFYVWVKIKAKNSRGNPIVLGLNEENWLRSLSLDDAYDFNNLHNVHKSPIIISKSKLTIKTTDKETIISKEVIEKTRNDLTTSNVRTKNSQDFNVTKPPWELWQDMVRETELTERGSEGKSKLNAIVKALQTSPIIQMSVGYRGTQLKASMFLKGSQKIVFKPKRYERDYIVPGGPYSGFDRHNGEIAAFHLDRFLGFCRAPIVTGRIVNLKTEALPHIQAELMKTFFKKGNNMCFYGVCYYCNKNEPACADGDMMEGSVTIWLPEGWNLKTWRHPWQRTYREGVKARWEVDSDYCTNTVMRTPPYSRGPRLMSIIDTAIFDYFIGNADRHHYETFVKGGDDAIVLHLDNGKSFGNPYWDEPSILAPLYQCCRILRSTWTMIKALDAQEERKLSEGLKESMSSEPVFPILTQEHLDALDRRLKKIVTYVNDCIKKHGESVVIVPDHS